MTRRSKGPTGETDPRIATLLERLEDDGALAPVVADFMARQSGARRRFGSNGLKVNGKLFALFTQGTLVVKLPRERVTALVASKIGKPFDPGHGRVMQEWLMITSGRASWMDLTKEAYAFATAGRRKGSLPSHESGAIRPFPCRPHRGRAPARRPRASRPRALRRARRLREGFPEWRAAGLPTETGAGV